MRALAQAGAGARLHARRQAYEYPIQGSLQSSNKNAARLALRKHLPFPNRPGGHPQQQQQQRRTFAGSSRHAADFTHAVIGAGAVGLAVARRLQSVPGASTVLIERHGAVGTETSSRNSEVIHAGLYYGADTLKTELCLAGKQQLYALCEAHGLPHRRCGKWIVAQTAEQLAELEKLHVFASSLDIPVRFVSPDEARGREPAVRASAAVLESPSTGILDSHAYMQFLLADFEERGGDVALGATVARIEPVDGGAAGWRIYTRGSPSEKTQEGEPEYITAETLVNSAGLAACAISNLVLPAARHRTQFYAKGSYFSYAAAHPRPRTLVYPAPVPGHGGLGTHLTLDMAGRIRFGPDVEWVDDPADLAPNPDPQRLSAALDDISAYLPGLDRDAVGLDYCGIRPKLSRDGAVGSAGKGFVDFYIHKEHDFHGFVNLLGIESPGLTSSLAIADRVHDLLYR